MKVLKYKDFSIFENSSLSQNDGILVIVDVQSDFKKYFPEDPNSFLKKLDTYCTEFKSVYQIWDSNNGSEPTYKFKNQKDLIEKHFGIKKLYKKIGFKEWIKKIFDDKTLNKFNSNKNKFRDGDAFQLKSGEFLIYIGNNHNWFLVPKKLVTLFKSLRNKKVILVGGADTECLEDIYDSMKSFNINVIYNHQYIYSAETGNKIKI